LPVKNYRTLLLLFINSVASKQFVNFNAQYSWIHLYDLFTHQISHSDSLKQNKFILHLAGKKKALKKISNFSKSQTICSYNVCVTNGGQLTFSLYMSGKAETI